MSRAERLSESRQLEVSSKKFGKPVTAGSNSLDSLVANGDVAIGLCHCDQPKAPVGSAQAIVPIQAEEETSGTRCSALCLPDLALWRLQRCAPICSADS